MSNGLQAYQGPGVLESEAIELFKILLNNAGGYTKDLIDPTLAPESQRRVKHLVDELGQQLLTVFNTVFPDYSQITLEDLDI